MTQRSLCLTCLHYYNGLWTDELDVLSRQGRCPYWKPIEVDDLSETLSDSDDEVNE